MKPALGVLAAFAAALLGTGAAWATIRLGDPTAEPAAAMAAGVSPPAHEQEAEPTGGDANTPGTDPPTTSTSASSASRTTAAGTSTSPTTTTPSTASPEAASSSASSTAREGPERDLFDEHYETPHPPPMHGGRTRGGARANLELYGNLHLGEFYGTGRRRAIPTTRTPRRGKGNHEPDGILSTGEFYSTGRREHSKPRLDGDTCGNLEPYGILLLGEHYTTGRRRASYSTGGRKASSQRRTQAPGRG